LAGCTPIADYRSFSARDIIWASYPFLSNDSVSRNVVVTVSRANAAQVAVYLDGVSLGTQNADQGTLTFNAGIVNPGLHGVIVRAAAGSFWVNQVDVR
jgi:hypothetical protein